MQFDAGLLAMLVVDPTAGRSLYVPSAEGEENRLQFDIDKREQVLYNW